jgi:hypothetical protein
MLIWRHADGVICGAPASMDRSQRHTGWTACTFGTRLLLAVCACSLLADIAAVAQESVPEPLGVAAPAPPPPGANYRPGFLDTVGRWLGVSKSAIDSQVKNTGKTLGAIGGQATGAAQGAAAVAQRAAGTVVGLPGTRVVSGRATCALAPNGAPDCGPAVDTLCRSKGLRSGQSLEIGSAQKCPFRVWISGRSPKAGECRTETFVMRAVCQ